MSFRDGNAVSDNDNKIAELQESMRRISQEMEKIIGKRKASEINDQRNTQPRVSFGSAGTGVGGNDISYIDGGGGHYRSSSRNDGFDAGGYGGGGRNDGLA